MPSPKILSLRGKYQNGEDNIGRDLVKTCLEECVLYRRGTGYFSSSSLRSYADVLERIINDRVKIEILCSPVVQDRTLIDVLAATKSEGERIIKTQKLCDQIVNDAVEFAKNPEDRTYRSKLLTYLIASGQMEIKFAVPRDFDEIRFDPEADPTDNERNIYHVKLGYFKFDDGSVVAFDGSFNESFSGHGAHVDRTQVFRSWVAADLDRLEETVGDIDRDWSAENDYVSIYALSRESLELIKRLSPKSKPIRQKTIKIEHQSKKDELDDYAPGLWDHQKIAIKKFLDVKRGILEMATGAGKTFTALSIISYLRGKKLIDTVIVSTYGSDLLKQWSGAIDKWQSSSNLVSVNEMTVFKMFTDGGRELQNFLNTPNGSIIIISRESSRLKKLLAARSFDREKTLIIHDEIHGFGSPAMVRELTGSHSLIRYRLGLSATPEREYDKEGTDFIENEVGPPVYQFALEDAIKECVLCEFDYIPIEFELTQEDKNKKRAVYAMKAEKARQGSPMSEKDFFTKLALVVKKAELKPSKIGEFLSDNSDKIKSSIFFVEDKEQGDQVCHQLARFTKRYKTYYMGTEAVYLDQLANGELDALVACQRLDEGIDIPSLKTVFLISSDRARLTTIQRIGRCLRLDKENPNKRATVIDMVLLSDEDKETSDGARMDWLTELSKTRCKKVKKNNEAR